MATSRGRSAVNRFIAQLPAEIEAKVLRGAARAAATIVADEAKARSASPEVANDINIRVRAEDGRIVVKIGVKAGWGRAVGIWLEYGTDPHFISVKDDARAGMSVRKINEQAKNGSLAIGGQFVGASVFHPGARAQPFLRPALDNKEAEAIAAAQSYIASRITRGGIIGPADTGSDRA